MNRYPFFVALLPLGILSAASLPAQVRTVDVADSKSIAITVNTGTVSLRSHKSTSVIVRATRIDGTSATTLIAVKREGPVLQFTEADDPGALLASTELVLPEGMPVRFAGYPATVNVSGLVGPLDVTIKQGTAEIENHTGTVTVNASAGRIVLRTISGTVRAKGTSETISVDSLVGVLDLETVAGNADLKRVHSSAATVKSQQGSIVFDGATQAGGSYVFTTLNGNITWRVPRDANATVHFGSALGSVQTGSLPNVHRPVSASSMSSVILGAGNADVKIMTYKGNISFLR
jgi:hypothetical protein